MAFKESTPHVELLSGGWWVEVTWTRDDAPQSSQIMTVGEARALIAAIQAVLPKPRAP